MTLPAALVLALILPAAPSAAREMPAIAFSPGAPPRSAPLPSSFASIVTGVAPAVVSVSARHRQGEAGGQEPEMEDPFFRHFFGDQLRRMPVPPAVGSGVIVSRDGYILTNSHVVEGSDEVIVTLAGRSGEKKAKIIGRDPKTDVAVLKIDGDDLPFITFGDSSKTEIGDVCLAIGNPFALGQTVTMGIISATGRGNIGIEDYEDFIQTDAAINPGNSGGALVDIQGRLIGINTAILSRTGGNQGIGFAVPSDLVRSIMESLIKQGRVVRGYLGAAIQDLTPALMEQFHLSGEQGALVGEVVDGSAAAAAGLKSGDVIVELDGKPVQDARHLRLQVAQTPPGKTIAVKIVRDGKPLTLKATLKELPEENEKGPSTEEPQEGFLSGVQLQDLSEELRAEIKAPRKLQGAVVTDVVAGSDAYMAGLRAGDVIEEVNRRPVKNADQAVAAARSGRGKDLLLRVWSAGVSRYVVVARGKR